MSRETRSDFYPAPIVDQDMRPGVVTRLIVFFLVLTGASIVFAIFRERLGDPFLLGMLGVLAMIGVGYLFATAIGFVQIAPRSTNDELSKAFVDTMAQGLIVTDLKGRVVYANRAYADMTGATNAADVKTVEGLLSDVPEASSIVYRLASGLRDGQSGDGEFRLAQAIRPGAEPGARWYRLRARTFNVPGQRQPLAAWQIADISRERAEQERFFLDLQKAIDHLDHAPAGFFAADQEGRVTYINATLAEWLGIDLASFTPGDTTLSEIVAGDGMALVRSVKADPGTTRNTVIDLDLARSTGEALPVRFMHRVTATRDGAPGPSRTIVLNRKQGEDASAELRASEIRFTRFFNSTPMAIAGVDQSGRIVRTNAPFLSLFSSVVDRDAVDRHVRLDTVVHERDRAAFAAALEKAKQRQADIAPIDTVLPGNDDRHIRFYVNAGRRRRRRRGRRGGGDRLCRRDDRAEGARGQDGAEPEDAGGRPACRRHRARLQQRADRHHHGVRPAADQPPAVGPVLPGHHEHQAERQPRCFAGAAAAGLLAQADAAAGSAEPDRRAGRPAHAAGAAGRQRHQAQGRPWPRPVAGAGRHRPVRAGRGQPRRQCARRHAGRRRADGPHPQRRRPTNASSSAIAKWCRPTMCWSRSRTPAPASRPT